MKFHLALKDGRWIGGMTCRRDTLQDSLDMLRERATEWKMPIVATRLGKYKQVFTVLPLKQGEKL